VVDTTQATFNIGVDTGGTFTDAFIADDAFQCGFCTPGQIMSAVGLIREGRAGDDPERVREGMSGNLCRCGAYRGITEAVLEAQRSPAQVGREEAA